ncbi:hypothetical protein [Carboxylicivirga taeanensis]|uniref:hypothetical protein n=1 Tax=Carboxylicivirga taeanensis TaxID=1416875 RepID=UPI003F6E1E41
MAQNLLCPLAANCDIYLGKKAELEPPLKIYQNVFCRRGIKGWSNCKYYNETKTSTQ